MVHWIRLSFLAALGLTVGGCGTYRTNAGGYHGPGSYRTPSDYTTIANKNLQPPPHVAASSPPSGDTDSPFKSMKLVWPVTEVHINRGFRPPTAPHHTGIDLGGTRGRPIFAAHEGRVIYVGHDFHGYGNMVLIEYDKEWATLYGHLDKIAVNENTLVKPGTRIGSMGRTGHATGVHLHFELIHYREPIDPLRSLMRPNKLARSEH